MDDLLGAGPYGTTIFRLLAALLAGALIGMERTYHGRAAGFRTHTLVCTASSLLMLLTVYQWELLPGVPLETVRVDPTRMAQGIMTGIGFLGAGTIMKEKLTVRGLTTAASIWMTAAIGIMVGMGFHFAAAVATVLTLGTLSIFRWVESISPSLRYARLIVRFERNRQLSEQALRELLVEHGISASRFSYVLDAGSDHFEYRLTIRARKAEYFGDLSRHLAGREGVRAFSLHPSSD